MSWPIFLMRSTPSRAKGTRSRSSARAHAAHVRTGDLIEVHSASARDTDRLGRVIGRALLGGETLALSGPLGSGKTALVRGVAVGLGAVASTVSSPTFVLIHEYQGRLPLAHVDLYRLNSGSELQSTGMSDYLSGQTVAAIEWADKALLSLPQDRVDILLEHLSTESRSITLRAAGPTSTALLNQIERELRRSGLSCRRLRVNPKKA
ncbi:MAG TPA: tRNA (adenosine(37)-N6)-threonylcarbamoyltransferase complex ATPase subunit type 1 TsaE [Nitrospira sp.]|nr:tRNA (adenosine(37)-N6)-threonylcarbamoyltransferase complex ATPase subunit type 1 TsaE [Nitrospira sp.]